MKKKKIVILTVDHVYANYAVKKLIAEFGNEISLIIESDCLYYNKTLLQSLQKYYQVSGLRYIFYQAIKLEIYKILTLFSDLVINNPENKFYEFKNLAKQKGIKVIKADNVNKDKYLKILKKIKPDLLVSVYFNQILKGETIKNARYGAINIHPAYLPEYKGVSPVFWALAKKEKEAGVTVHTINTGIDTGNILKREKIKINKDDSEDSLYWKLTKVGTPMLIYVIKNITTLKPLKIDNKKGKYFSLPTKTAVLDYLSSKPFFNFEDYLGINYFWLDRPKIYNLIQFMATGGFMSSVMRKLPEIKNKNIFDLGCGTGNLIDYAEPKKYLGWDFNKEFIKNAKNKHKRKYMFEVADIIKKSFPKNNFDFVVITNVLHHLNISNVEKLFEKISKQKNFKNFVIIESRPKNKLGQVIGKFDAGETFRNYDIYKKLLIKHFAIEKYEIVSAPFGTYTYLVAKMGPKNKANKEIRLKVPSKRDYINHLKKYSQYTFSQDWINWGTHIIPFRAQRTIKIIDNYYDSDAKVLDLGSGIGLTLHLLGQKYKNAQGCDIDKNAIKGSKALLKSVGAKNKVSIYDGKKLPFKDNSFDVVCSLEVVEHAAEAEIMLKEAARVLKKDGIAIITTPNKYWLLETHYRLYFLSILPQKIADVYVRFFKKGEEYDVDPYTYKRFTKMVGKYFNYEDITFDMISEYKYFELDVERGEKVAYMANLIALMQILDNIPHIRNLYKLFEVLVLNASAGWVLIARKK